MRFMFQAQAQHALKIQNNEYQAQTYKQLILFPKTRRGASLALVPLSGLPMAIW